MNTNNYSYWDQTKNNLHSYYYTCSHYFDTDLNDETEIKTDKTPVLLVHGYLHNQSAWTDFKSKIVSNDKIGSIFTINLGTPFHSIEEYSSMVEQRAKKIAELTKRNDLILVGHSMGGLVSSHFALNHQSETKVKKVITLGSPLKGTYLGYFGIGTCARQMIYGSEFTKKLQKQIQDSKEIQFHNIGSQYDGIILPNNSAFLDPSQHIEVDELQDIGHSAYLTSEKVHQLVINSLTQVQSM